ncbi:MAG: histidinol-phosphate transaminase [Acidothermus sp.]|nr:histidinol-phosphate transaminase [Acidothermus sp.]MCL6537745.1 histidinol-phosphate transaminase [Acidothermus sp.]
MSPEFAPPPRFTPPLRADLVGEEPYGAPQLAVAVRLNTNENPYPPPPAVVADMAEEIGRIAGGLNRYPDREATVLRADLAGYLAHTEGVTVDVDRVWAANGSNEILHQLLLAFGGPDRCALGFSPTYSMYPQYCRDTFTRYVTEPRRADFTVDADAAVAAVRRHQPAVTLLASPNNPTGTALPLEVTRAIAEAAAEHNGLVVVDEAYAEFRRPGTPSALTLLDELANLVVTRTMSKAFAAAGVRLGYLVADSRIVNGLRIVRLPYHLSSVTQAVARVALAHADELLAQVAAIRAERDAMVAWLRSEGFTVADSDANFVLTGIFQDSHEVWQRLVDRGVLVRETGPQGWLRVSIGTPEEMAAFREAFLAVASPARREEFVR